MSYIWYNADIDFVVEGEGGLGDQGQTEIFGFPPKKLCKHCFSFQSLFCEWLLFFKLQSPVHFESKKIIRPKRVGSKKVLIPKKIMGPKNLDPKIWIQRNFWVWLNQFQLYLCCHNLIWPVLTWLDLSWLNFNWSKLTWHI